MAERAAVERAAAVTPKRAQALSSEAKAAQRDARESEWELKEEAMYVFKLADKDGSGGLDETEVEAVRAASTRAHPSSES